jgi:cupin fold WbuC family metalloprotein
MPLALPNVTGDVFALTEEILAQGCREARESPRRRMLLPLHRSQEAVVQRMLNFFQPGTYIQPHLHPLPHATETIQVLRGSLGFLIFHEDGSVKSKHVLRANGLGLIDIEARVWHGFVTLEPDTIILEIKRGPYDQQHDKIFAPWAPKENEPGAAAYLARLAGDQGW